MHKTLRALPSLDFLRGFEAAGRRLSFTLAAEELFVTQSALSRQVKALEDALGVPLFERRHRALALTPAGAAFHRDVTDDSCARSPRRPTSREAAQRAPGLTVSTTVSFASLWLIPRLSRVPRRAIRRSRSTSPPTIAWSTSRAATSTSRSAICATPARRDGAVRLFGERMMPVASPKLVRRRGTPLAQPADLARHVLLHLDDPEGRMPWLDWPAWLAANGQPGLKPAGIAALHALRPGDPGRGRRAGRGARAHSAHRRASARRPARRAVRRSATIRRAATTRSSRRTPASAPTSRRSSRGCATRPREPEATRSKHRRVRKRDAATDRACSHRAVARAIERFAWIDASRRSSRARACSILPRAAAATRATSRRGARAWSPSTATRRRSPRCAAVAGVETRAGRSRRRRVAVRRRALRRDRRRQLPASAAVRTAARCAAPTTACSSTRRSRRQRGLRPARRIPDFLLHEATSCCDRVREPPDGGRVRAGTRRDRRRPRRRAAAGRRGRGARGRPPLVA